MASQLYPQIPNAPPEGGFERYNRVRDIRNELRVLREQRNVSYKKYWSIFSYMKIFCLYIHNFILLLLYAFESPNQDQAT